MNQEKEKIFHWGRNGKRIWILLIVLLSSGLFGCGKKDAYTVSLEGQGFTEVSESPETEERETEATAASEDSGSRIYVYICGAVKYPGVYEFFGDTRVFQVVERAGGLLPEACEAAMNQAQAVGDGERIYVPTLEEWEQGLEETLEESEATVKDDGLVNINTADEMELCTLPGVGETRARAIMEYRREHGDFEKIEDIQNVSGIKSGLFGKIKDLIKVR